MTTKDLTKELDSLARSLRALTVEAAAAVATALELERRRGLKPANKYEPKALTLAEISAALGAATRRPSASIDLRKDVFERRCERNAVAFADLFAAAVKAGRPAPAGERFAPRYTGLSAGVRSAYDAVPKWGTTAINADCVAWTRAAAYVLAWIVPEYAYNAIYGYSCRVINRSTDYIASSRLEEKLRGKVADWVDASTILLCEVDAAGQILRINGLDPAPFIELSRIVAAGNPDPLGILPALPAGQAAAAS